MFYNMNLTIQQIFDVKFVLSGKKKSEIAVDIGISNSNQFSTIERYKGLQDKLDEYFDQLNPEINSIVRKITEMDHSVIIEPSATYKDKPDFKEKYIALQEQLLKSREERIAYLEAERKRIIEKYGDVYK